MNPRNKIIITLVVTLVLLVPAAAWTIDGGAPAMAATFRRLGYFPFPR
jgi:hypothetical protein